MKLEAINFWLDYISDLNIPYLFVVPHDSRWVSVNPDGSHDSFKPLIERHGYRLVREQPKFPAGVDGIYLKRFIPLGEANMTREPVQSANIKSIGYSLPTQTLEIEFVRGGIYSFQGVPPETHRDLLRAASVGKYFATYIKDKYEYVKSQEGSKT
jgi:hypothetical protein